LIGAITKPTQFLGPWFLACVMLSDDGVALSYALVADVCVTADQDAHLGSCLTTEPAIISLIAWCRLLAFGAAFVSDRFPTVADLAPLFLGDIL